MNAGSLKVSFFDQYLREISQHILSYCKTYGTSENIYRIYPKYLDTLTLYHTCPDFEQVPFGDTLMCQKTAGKVADTVFGGM